MVRRPMVAHDHPLAIASAFEIFDECQGALVRLLGKLRSGRETGGRPAAQRMVAGTRKQNGATRDRGPRLVESRLPGTA